MSPVAVRHGEVRETYVTYCSSPLGFLWVDDCPLNRRSMLIKRIRLSALRREFKTDYHKFSSQTSRRGNFITPVMRRVMIEFD
jgi:hypothetical protein